MKLTDVTRKALTLRRQQKKLKAQGYKHLDCGALIKPFVGIWNGDEIITAVEIAADGKGLFVKTEKTGRILGSMPVQQKVA